MSRSKIIMMSFDIWIMIRCRSIVLTILISKDQTQISGHPSFISVFLDYNGVPNIEFTFWPLISKDTSIDLISDCILVDISYSISHAIAGTIKYPVCKPSRLSFRPRDFFPGTFFGKPKCNIIGYDMVYDIRYYIISEYCVLHRYTISYTVSYTISWFVPLN
jgi:hypothetical protein